MEGAYLRNWDQIINVGMIQHASLEDTRVECPTYRLAEIGMTFNVRGNVCKHQRHEPLAIGRGRGRGLGTCSPGKFKSESLKLPFLASILRSIAVSKRL